MPIFYFDKENSYLEQINLKEVDNVYILKNAALEEILFNRNVIGLNFTMACEASTRAFLAHFSEEINHLSGNVAELMILTKGMYYWLHNAFMHVFDTNLEINFVYTNRVKVSLDSAVVKIRAANFDVPVEHLIICDTIASGATIIASLDKYMQYYKLKKVFIFTIAGSKVGGQTISKYCKAHGIELTLVYGLALFGLGSNGFDLSFLHSDTITSSEYLSRAEIVFKRKPVSSAGWDFGTQAQALRKYRMLCWIEARYWGLENSDVFLETEPPYDVRLIEKEHAAYKDRFPDLKSLFI